ncbi:ComEA family DNA-binding protein [Caldimonas aquatica]|uniref:Helix-hairpin-helix domain-containing protein n=1 Tax=Caldimonas aquatica TaxID=376175 RepID=A0ABY6MQI7_9BURK|nr:helix-hairpin-helix domain-containing protein [Schlegelella aquatica]UZD54153.1 helix-hairpin-helix domain-containing protein [Schlegelella aquatica]
MTIFRSAALALMLALPWSLGHTAGAVRVELNRATAVQLAEVKGLGPKLTQRILDERRKGPFRGWDDFIQRVPGIGPASAARLSQAGLRIEGASYALATALKPTAASAQPSANSR